MTDCPLKIDKPKCVSCEFSKENLCDYPYSKNQKEADELVEILQ